jgi:hypothetical protein
MPRKHERIKSRGDARVARRDSKGQFSEVEDVGRSPRQDRQRKAKTAAKPGQGHRNVKEQRRR